MLTIGKLEFLPNLVKLPDLEIISNYQIVHDLVKMHQIWSNFVKNVPNSTIFGQILSKLVEFYKLQSTLTSFSRILPNSVKLSDLENNIKLYQVLHNLVKSYQIWSKCTGFGQILAGGTLLNLVKLHWYWIKIYQIWSRKLPNGTKIG